MHALGITIGTLPFGYTDIERMLGAATLLFIETGKIVSTAKVRKMGAGDKRQRLAAIAELLRDTADQIDRVTL